MSSEKQIYYMNVVAQAVENAGEALARPAPSTQYEVVRRLRQIANSQAEQMRNTKLEETREQIMQLVDQVKATQPDTAIKIERLFSRIVTRPEELTKDREVRQLIDRLQISPESPGSDKAENTIRAVAAVYRGMGELVRSNPGTFTEAVISILETEGYLETERKAEG